MKKIIPVVLISALCMAGVVAKGVTANEAPIADAGLSRYAAQDPVQLDGNASYDPDSSGPLSCTWTQVDGPSVEITHGDTATPTISGFVQTDEIQECQFELVVSDGELAGRPDTVKVFIVPRFGEDFVRHVNPPFDTNLPTVIVLGGGGCVAPPWEPDEEYTTVRTANLLFFHDGYIPTGQVENSPTYYGCGDMVIVYLSRMAPDYRLPIQIMGASSGGAAALDVGIRLNLTYGDARYAVNRLTLEDTGFACRPYEDYLKSIGAFVASSVDGEQCWLDNYVSERAQFYPNVLNVGFEQVSHTLAMDWYDGTLWSPESNTFDNGVVGGEYWSVMGSGKNLQLAWTPDAQMYKFKWHGDAYGGYMDFYDEPNHPGRLPEPVTLVGPADGTVVSADGAVLSCQESENAVGYQLLFGPDPYHLVYLFSDTPCPPSEPVNTFPFQRTWWTVRAYDPHGSTIHADPMYIDAESVIPQPIENVATGQTYASIQQAINDAHPGDEVVVSPGACQYCENINFKGKNITLRSAAPHDPTVVAATIINGGHRASAVTFSGTEEATCVLDGLTIAGGMVGISCREASPTIKNCTIGGGQRSMEFRHGSEPTVVDCTFFGQIQENDPGLIAHWRLDETDGIIAHDSVGTNDGAVMGEALWQPDAGRVDGALAFDGTTFVVADRILDPANKPFSVRAWIQGGAPGQVLISQGENWLMADAREGMLTTELAPPAGRIAVPPLVSEVVITDGLWHRVAFVWDGSSRRLYVDDVLAAEDAQSRLAGCSGGLHIGAGKGVDPATYWSGLIDDVRIYNRAVKP
jgi:hypothetical protein